MPILQNVKKVPDLRFPEFTEEWNIKKLGEIGKIVAGLTYNPSSIDDKGVLVLRSSNVQNRHLAFEDNVYVKAEVGSFNPVFNEDILVCVRNGSRNLIGKNVLVNESTTGVAFGAFMAVYRSEYNKYLFQIFDTDIYKRQVHRNLGATINSINGSDLKKFSVPFPSSQEQQKIASFLSSIDEWIENLRLQKVSLEKYKKGMMQKIFSQEVRFKDEDGKEFSDWEEKKLGDFLIIKLREVNTPKQFYRSIGIRSHFKGTFQRLDADPNKISMDKLFEVRENDLIINITFAWEGAMAIAKKDDENGLVSHRFPTYVFDEKITTHNFFRYVFPTKKFKYILGNISPGGAGRNRVLNKKDFLNIKVEIPSLPEQQKITEFLFSLDSIIDLKRGQISQAEQWKKGLMQKMFI